MITDILKTVMTDSGCSFIVYDQEQLANLYTDQSNTIDLVGIIIQPSEIQLEIRANAIVERFNTIRIEVVQQVQLEDKAETNEAKLQECLDTIKQIIVRLIARAEFKTILPATATRVLESRYDANVIGWSVGLNLYWLKNETRIPCL